MKKTLSLILAAGVCVSLFAADILTYAPIQGNVKSYTKTEFSIASKFGSYFRTPSIKTTHLFDSDGKEIESSELTPKDVEINTISSSYDTNGNLTTQVCTTAEDEAIWRTEFKYKGNKMSEVSEYDAKNSLKSKTIYSYEKGNIVEETSYDGDGALVWKVIYKYAANNKLESVDQYLSNGNLSEKEVYSYDSNGVLTSIAHLDNLANQLFEEVFRYNNNGSLNEITTYDSNKQITKRIVVKYDKQGNPSKVSEWDVSFKFGTTVNELAAQYEYDYNYSDSMTAQLSEK